MSVIQSTPIQWDFIIDKILREQCVLVAGRELFNASTKEDNGQNGLLKHLDIFNNPNIH